MTNLRPRRRRHVLTVSATALVATGLLTAATSSPSSAIESPVAFSAVDLPTYQTDGIAWTVASTSGLVFVGGGFSTLRPPGAAAGDPASVPRANFAVLDAATGAPASCAPSFERPGATSPAVVRALALSPDNATLYVGGLFSVADGLRVDNVAAIDIATCKVVPSFRPVVDGNVRALAASASRVYIGGEFTRVAGTGRGRLAAVSSVTTASPGTLLPWVPYFDDNVESLALSPDGARLVVGGKFATANGVDSHALAVLSASSASVERAYPGFIMAKSHVKHIAVDLTGFYTANEGDGAGVFDGRIAVDWSTLNERWRDVCLGATQSVLVWRSVLYSASHAHNCIVQGEYPDGTRHHLLAQTTSSPTTKLAWFPNTNEGMGEAIGPRDLAVARTAGADYLYVVGEFTGVNGHSQVGITRFSDKPDATPAGLKLSVTSFKAGKVQVAWRPATDNDNRTLTYSLFRDGGATPIWTTTSPSTFWARPQVTFVDDQPAGSTHRYRVSASDGLTTITSPWRQATTASASSTYAQHVLADGATLYWRYDDPADVYLSDSSGSDLGTVRGGATFGVTGPIPGDTSKAITLPGGGSSFLYSDHLAPAPTKLSVETWFRTTTRFGGKIIGYGDKFELKSFYYDRHLYLSNSGQVNWGVQGWTRSVITSPRAYNDGAWHHVVGTLDGGRMALYLDGQLVGTSFIANPLTYTGLWRIGDDAVTGWPGSPSVSSLAGSWDETAIYPVALTAAQVADHYSFGASDSQPPSAPSGVSATANPGGGVALAWRASTDDVGVSGYEVYRATNSATQPSPATRIATVAGTATTYLDPTPVVGTRNFYRVIALDAAGHRSDPSEQVSVVVFPPRPSPSTSSPTPTPTPLTATSAAAPRATATGTTGTTGTSRTPGAKGTTDPADRPGSGTAAPRSSSPVTTTEGGAPASP